MKKLALLLVLLVVQHIPTYALRAYPRMQVGADATDQYTNLLTNKRIAVVVNQTSVMNGNQHLVDYLNEQGLNIVKIFAPEHGFRGTADAGEKLNNSIDETTKLPIVSLYGKHDKPTKADLQDVDLVIYDIQDVGARFYTFISTLQYVMEACAENNKELLLLDRPNPNANYVDGPVLEMANKSFVGMQAVPIVYGMTVGEYAKMLNGENLLANKKQCNLTVIKCKNYTHKTVYDLPIAPSPNLKNATAINLYPSLCLFEGTEVSVGRGTDAPFCVWGHPSYKANYSFTPMPNIGSKEPPYNGKKCYGKDLQNAPKGKFTLQYILQAYKLCTDKSKFFNSFFPKLAGNTTLQKQIIQGLSEEKIKATWQPAIDKFKKIRKKYLLYPDFE